MVSACKGAMNVDFLSWTIRNEKKKKSRITCWF